MGLVATYLGVALLVGTGPPAESPTRTLDCEGAATVGAPSLIVRGARAVTVSVPERLAGRLVMT